ncbi:hypothetical protein BKA93DRAFT_825594 [Sparassis latifolia]
MDTVEPSSSASDSPPYRSRSLRSHSQQSSVSPPPRPSRSRVDRDRDREREYLGSRSKLFSRLISREERDASRLRSVLVRTTDRLEEETRRADEAERRVLDTLHKLRAAREETMIAQASAARANEELRLYRSRLDEAQREIHRGQQIIDDLEQARVDAEAEAARARTIARRFREEHLVAKALEEGRRQGYQEGFSRGKDLASYEKRTSERADQRRYTRQKPIESISEEDDVEDDGQYSRRSLIVAPMARTPMQPSWRAPSRQSSSRASRRSPPRLSDIAPITSSTPVRSVITPLRTPSPSRVHLKTPDPTPIPDPSVTQPRRDTPITPIPMNQPPPSPVHPDYDIPPDNWIPYLNEQTGMFIPPPHELSRPVSPHSPSPSLPDPADPPRAAAVEQPVRARDYAYSQPVERLPVSLPGHHTTMSPQSRTSTNISQYDIVNARGEGAAGGHRNPHEALAGLHQVIDASMAFNPGVERSKTPATAREDASPRGSRHREDGRARTPGPSPGGSRDRDANENQGSRSPLERLFKLRYRNRRSPGSSGVPDIFVESPSTGPSASTSHVGQTAGQEGFLSPEYTPRPLSAPEDIAVRDSTPADQRPLPPLPEIGLTSADMAFPLDQLPPGFLATSFTPQVKPSDIPAQYEPEITSTPHHQRPPRTPRSLYAEAPVPADVVYPDPPGKIRSPHTGAARPLTPSATPSSPPARSGSGSQSGVLSPLSLRLGSPLRL